MSRPAYYGRPALVARYTPAGVQVVALVQYLGAVLLIAAAVDALSRRRAIRR